MDIGDEKGPQPYFLLKGAYDTVYFDINDLFLEMAWHMSSYPATIIRSDLLDEIGWEGMSDKYFKEDRVSLSHIGLYFEALAKKNKVKAIHIPIGSDEVGISSYRKDSMWNYATFMVWCEHWPNTVYALPDIYENKESGKKKAFSILNVSKDTFTKISGKKYSKSAVNKFISSNKGRFNFQNNNFTVLTGDDDIQERFFYDKTAHEEYRNYMSGDGKSFGINTDSYPMYFFRTDCDSAFIVWTEKDLDK